MTCIFQFLSKDCQFIKHGCVQFDQSCVKEKTFKNFRSLKAQTLVQHLLASLTQGKLRLSTKMQPVKKVKKIKEQQRVF